MGPRVRAAMLAGLLVLLVTVVFGGYAIAHQIYEARRETPARKLKKAFKSLVGELKSSPGKLDRGEQMNREKDMSNA